MTAGYRVKALQYLRPVPYVTVETGSFRRAHVPQVDVNHLSTRYVKFTRGDSDASHLCYAATL